MADHQEIELIAPKGKETENDREEEKEKEKVTSEEKKSKKKSKKEKKEKKDVEQKLEQNQEEKSQDSKKPEESKEEKQSKEEEKPKDSKEEEKPQEAKKPEENPQESKDSKEEEKPKEEESPAKEEEEKSFDKYLEKNRSFLEKATLFLLQMVAPSEKREEMRALMIGLDAAGKTTLLYHLKMSEVISTIPTIGFNVETVEYRGLVFNIWDVGGQGPIRKLWPHYYEGTRILFWLIDLSDRYRLEESVEAFRKVITSPQMKDYILVILANKSDLPKILPVEEVIKAFNFDELEIESKAIFKISAISKEGVDEAWDYVGSCFAKQISVEKPTIGVEHSIDTIEPFARATFSFEKFFFGIFWLSLGLFIQPFKKHFQAISSIILLIMCGLAIASTILFFLNRDSVVHVEVAEAVGPIIVMIGVLLVLNFLRSVETDKKLTSEADELQMIPPLRKKLLPEVCRMASGSLARNGLQFAIATIITILVTTLHSLIPLIRRKFQYASPSEHLPSFLVTTFNLITSIFFVGSFVFLLCFIVLDSFERYRLRFTWRMQFFTSLVQIHKSKESEGLPFVDLMKPVNLKIWMELRTELKATGIMTLAVVQGVNGVAAVGAIGFLVYILLAAVLSSERTAFIYLAFWDIASIVAILLVYIVISSRYNALLDEHTTILLKLKTKAKLLPLTNSKEPINKDELDEFCDLVDSVTATMENCERYAMLFSFKMDGDFISTALGSIVLPLAVLASNTLLNFDFGI